MRITASRLATTIALAAGASLPTARAEIPSADIPQADHALLQQASPNVSVIERFDGPPGLTGYVINERGSQQAPVVVWITDDHRHMLAGNLFDQHGRNLTKVAGDHYGAESPVTQLVAMAVENAVENALSNRGSGSGPSPGGPDSAPWTPASPASSPWTPAGSGSAERDGDAPSVSPAPPAAPAAPEADEDGKAALREQLNQAGDNGFEVNDPDSVTRAVGGVRALRQHGSVIPEQPPADGRPLISVYYDPNCGPCRSLIRGMDSAAIQALDGAGLTWVPVALSGNPQKAELAIAQGTPQAVRKSVSPGGGSHINASRIIGPEDRKAIRVNNTILSDTLIAVTPVAVIEYPDNTATVMVGVSPEKLARAVNDPPATMGADTEDGPAPAEGEPAEVAETGAEKPQDPPADANES